MLPKHQLPVSIRNLRAKLRPLRRPIVWGSIVFLGVFTLFSVELSSNSGQFSAWSSFGEQRLDPNQDSEENLSEDLSAIAADIDSLSVLEEDMKQMERSVPILPMTNFKPSTPDRTETSDPSSFTSPPAIVPNPSSPGLGNIFLSGNATQVQLDNVLSPDASGGSMNPRGSGNGINQGWGNGGANSSAIALTNHNLPNPDTSGTNVSALQQAIMRRSATVNPQSPAGGVALPQTATLPQSTNNPPRESFDASNPSDRRPSSSTQGTNRLTEAQTNSFTPSRSADIPNPDRISTNSQVEQVIPTAQGLTPLSPRSSQGTNASARGYNSYNQSVQNNNPTASSNSYQYLLQSSQLNSVTGVTGVTGVTTPEPLIHPRSATTLRTSTAPQTLTSPLPPGNPSNVGIVTPQNPADPIAPSTVPLSPNPSVQSTPSLRSVEVPQAIQPNLPNANVPNTNVPNPNGLSSGATNSNLSRSQGQTLQPAPAFTVPRPIPGRYIGGGQINTFSNP